VIYRFLPDPPVNSESGPIMVEIELTPCVEKDDVRGLPPGVVMRCHLIVGSLRVPCRGDVASDPESPKPLDS
jgi:hypothetical protein